MCLNAILVIVAPWLGTTGSNRMSKIKIRTPIVEYFAVESLEIYDRAFISYLPITPDPNAFKVPP